jgi:pimeloyl-ACP methyl ester carboxylesterase
MGGLLLRDHWFDLPLNHADPHGQTIRVYAREAVSAEKVATGSDRGLPWLLFLAGGPGGKAARPDDGSAWLHRAAQDYRVLLLDQRGTGRSTPATAATLDRQGDAAAQADYLAHFRADSIVADAELIRTRLLGDQQWTVLGQSYGGFCALTYLSFAPHGMAAALIAGGLGPLEATADEVYAATYRAVEAKNALFHQAFPAARAQVDAVAEQIRRHAVQLPDGSPLTIERFQAVGIALGQRSTASSLAFLLEEAFVDGLSGRQLSDTFLAGAWQQLSFAPGPLYAVIHEAIYSHGAPTRWAAQRVRHDFPQFSPDADPLLLTGEMIYPWMFDVDPALRPLQETADALAERSWSPLYDLNVLASNDVAVAAALYTDDMYVDATLSRRTAAQVKGVRLWETNAYEHDGLRETADVVDRLIRMARGEL